MSEGGAEAFFRIQPWTPEARQRVEELQVREYRSLADELGFDGDADRAYEHFTRDRALPQDPKAGSIWQKLGLAPPKSEQERLAIEAQYTELFERIKSVTPPTRYEDPRDYFTMVLLLDAILDHLVRKGETVAQAPLLASLPSGDTNARIIAGSASVPTLLLFERGIFRFCVDMANVLGWTLAPLTAQQISDEFALVNLPRNYYISPEASQYFFASLHAYVVDGSPKADEDLVPRPSNNYLLAMTMAPQMQRFVMAHELAHVGMGHLQEPQSKEQEHQADSASAYVVSKMAEESFGSWAVGFWACDFTLTALHFLEKSIGLLAYGTERLRWVSSSHPDPISRRTRLRGYAARTEGVQDVSIAAAEALCGVTDAVFKHLWELNGPFLYKAHKDGARPAVSWRIHTETSLAPAN